MALEIALDPESLSKPISRVAMLVVHSNPLAEPGAGDAGGMTVYVSKMAQALAAQGVQVDLYTRRDGSGPDETQLFPGVRVIQIEAGSTGLSKQEIPAHLPEFTSNLIKASMQLQGASEGQSPYDLIHSHYWLSGRVASILKARWEVPFVHTFHTLGRVKNRARRVDDALEPETRLNGEARVIADACAIVASTNEERQSLIELYAAHPERIHLVHPGVDHKLFRPANRALAKRRLGMGDGRLILFAGRLQPLKAADTAVRAAAVLLSRPGLADLRLMVVGGPSGTNGLRELERLRALAIELGIESSVEFAPAQPQTKLARYYQAADVCLVPSVTESFGLVALEAQACGLPVVASNVGGLRSIIQEGKTGFLVEPGDSLGFADRAESLLANPGALAKMGAQAAASAAEFSWEGSAAELYDLYETSTGRHGAAFGGNP
ncbi:MAG: glycosyltransferase [Actinomycetota bacterium]